jgi:CheY-like chemotaxis protein
MFKSLTNLSEVPNPELAGAPAKPVVLIVEDDASLVKVYSKVLELNGYEVITASYALPAMFRVVRRQPDVILADLNMPKMSGLELLAQLKAHEDTKDIPVVMITGSVYPEDRDAAFKAGCSAYIKKPVDTKEFLQQIAALVRATNGGNPVATLPSGAPAAAKPAIANRC